VTPARTVFLELILGALDGVPFQYEWSVPRMQALQSSQYASHPASVNDARRKRFQAATEAILFELRLNPRHFLYTSFVVFRIALWRIGRQFATLGEWVDLGPAHVKSADGYLPNARTNARDEGIQKLQATRPVPLDNLDLHTFLAGFDAGERYGMDVREGNSTQPHRL
jgi:hypothetical protein